MRIIIIIQSLIILVGAYYIFTLSQADPVTSNPVLVTPPQATPNNYVPPSSNPPVVESVPVTASSSISGPSDAGMEYPILDSEVHAQ